MYFCSHPINYRVAKVEWPRFLQKKMGYESKTQLQSIKKPAALSAAGFWFFYGGEGGIRTLGRALNPTTV